MGSLFKWLVSATAILTTLYVLNTYSFSRVPNGFQVKGPKSNTVVTYNNGTTRIKNNVTTNKNNNIESILNIKGTTLDGSINNMTTKNQGIAATYDLNKRKGDATGQWKTLNGALDVDYSSIYANSLNKWVSRIETVTVGNNYNFIYKR